MTLAYSKWQTPLDTPFETLVRPLIVGAWRPTFRLAIASQRPLPAAEWKSVPTSGSSVPLEVLHGTLVFLCLLA